MNNKIWPIFYENNENVIIGHVYIDENKRMNIKIHDLSYKLTEIFISVSGYVDQETDNFMNITHYSAHHKKFFN